MPQENVFKVGTIVKLKSGGPDMTVNQTPEAGRTIHVCQWFAGKKLELGRFPYDSLELVREA